MPKSYFDFREPGSGRRLASEEIIPDEFTLHAAGEEVVWRDAIVVEERHHTHAWEVPEYFSPTPRLHVSLNTMNTVECFADGKWYHDTLPTGSVFLFPTEMSSRWRWGNESLHVLDIQFAPLFLARSVPDFATKEFTFHYATADIKIERLAFCLHDEQVNGCPGGRLFGESVATALAAHLLAKYAVFPTTFKQYQRGLSKADLKRVTDYLQDNLAADVSLDTLAGLVAISPDHFCRLFKQSTGKTPHQFVIEKRVERAKILLLRGGMSIAEVALTVGFVDVSHLNRCMKRLLGTTPGKVQQRG